MHTPLNRCLSFKMLSVRRDTLDSTSSLGDDWSRHGSAQPNPVLVLPYRFDRRMSDLPPATILSPPPRLGSPKLPSKSLHHVRLRSDSGLALHTNKAALRQYTNYNTDGSMRSTPEPAEPLSYDVAASKEALSLGNGRSTELREPPRRSRPLPNFFDPEVIRMAFCNPTTGQRLCRFAQSKHCAADMEFLLKVEEYSRAFGAMTSLISHISANFTGITAISPLGLPTDLSSVLKTNTKQCARLALPPLEKLYHDAKVSVEERLAKNLYPEYVKYQLTQCMRSSMSVSRWLTGGFKSAYPGLGEAFCLTDPLQPDNPIVYASDGLLRMSGYRRQEIINKNCRILQGLSTDPDAAHRIREAISLGRETTELIINHQKDGTPFWNLLFVCPLFEQGNLRYHLGAQINVSESMGTDHQDILRILNFGMPSEAFPHPPTMNTQERPVWRAPASVSQERIQPERRPSQRSPMRRSHGHRLFRGFPRKSAARSQSPRPATPAVPIPVTEDPPSAKRWAYTTRNSQLEPKPDEYSTPYSRFFVMRYIPTSAQPCQSHGDRRNVNAVRMPISFCSSYALELLGLGTKSRDAVLEHDVFNVLATYINSPSINRGLRATVLDKIAAGDAISVDLMATADSPSAKTQPGKHSRNRSVIRTATMLGGVGAVAGATFSVEMDSKPRLSDAFDRGAEILSHVFFGPKMRKLVSHWAPLKDAEGNIGWVVLVLTPAIVT
ncbi:hypothetical protein B0T25DRAFT_185405 [Lasiosphaeria hispida]|uniref:LOV domain-containing protein n=1 Tax=Lasiosphaeria hispida TaxID=260671 RepID=A0AAJ0MDS5_9PEZI|nr:hypothetical protein B0T25DRAFT_185405 [Lasiosphaeria hispida]